MSSVVYSLRKKPRPSSRSALGGLGRLGGLSAFAALTFLGLLGGCDGCSSRARTESSRPPETFISRETDVVVQLRDIGALVADPSNWPVLPDAVVSLEQLEVLRAQIKRDFGFDPTTRAGLAKAGIRDSGPIWIGLKKQSNPTEGSILCIVPVNDHARFEAIVRHILGRQGMRPEIRDSSSRAGVRVTVDAQQSAESTAAAWSFRDGYALLSLGSYPEASLAEALSLSADRSLAGDPEFLKLSQGLGSEDNLEFRIFIPPLGTAAIEELRAVLTEEANAAGVNVRDLDLPSVAGAGLRLNLKTSSIGAVLRLFVGSAYRGQLKDLLRPVPPADHVAQILGTDGAFLRVEWAIPTEAIHTALADKETRAQLEKALSPDLLASLSGRGGLVVTLRDLTHLAPDVLQRDPTQAVAFLLAASTKSSKDDSGKNVEALGQLIDDLNRTYALSGGALTYELKDETIAVGNDRELLKASWNKPKGDGLLGDQTGLVAELSFAPLVAGLKAYPLSSVPLLMRAVVLKATQVLQAFEQARLVVQAEDDGFSTRFTVKLKEVSSK
ncbi:MAG: hypothetical protein IPK13_08495 [Deltaproteobacteria bacterium]|nr:hypothetical protein [Deltaproteobacteria bacterium]